MIGATCNPIKCMTTGNDNTRVPLHPEQPLSDYRRRRTRQAALHILYAFAMQDGRRPLSKTCQDITDFCVEETSLSADTALDADFMALLVSGVLDNTDTIDAIIKQYLSDRWKFSRIDIVMKDLLRLGVYELSMRPEITIATIINEYIEISRGYFNESETSFVNALLDNAAAALRTLEEDDTAIPDHDLDITDEDGVSTSEEEDTP